MTKLQFEKHYAEFWTFLNSPQDQFEENLKEIVQKIETLGVARICDISSRQKTSKSLWGKFQRKIQSPMMSEEANPLTMEEPEIDGNLPNKQMVRV